MLPRNRVLAALLLASLGGGVTADTFQDVPRGHWAYQAIRRLQASGMIQGRGKRFEGQRAFSRYEMAVVLARYLEKLQVARSSVQKSLDRTYPLMKRLAKEFSSELDLLGVKHQELLARVTSLETRTDLHDRQLEELRTLVEENRQLLQAMRGSPMASRPPRRSPEDRRAAAEPASTRSHPAGNHPSVYRTVSPPPQELMFRAGAPSQPPTSRPALELAGVPRPGSVFTTGSSAGVRPPANLRLQSLRMRARALLEDNQPGGRGTSRAAYRPPQRTPEPRSRRPASRPAPRRDASEALVDVMGQVERGEMDLATATRFGQQMEEELERSSPRRGRSRSVVYPLTERLFGPGGFGPPATD